jgi:enoyl-CoA hydratase/carnithine racemase
MMACVIPARDLDVLDPSRHIDAGAPLIVVDLDGGVPAVPPEPVPSAVLIGVTRRPVTAELASFAAGLDCTLAPAGDQRWMVAVPDVDAAVDGIAAMVSTAPRAAAALAGLLRMTSRLSVRDGLHAESLTYSMLLAGPEFRRWLASRPRRPVVPPAGVPAVLVDRAGDHLTVTLNRPERHNAFDRQVRDGLAEALDLARADETIAEVHLRGAGPSFCSGGDLDEFGTTPDVVTAHLIRLERSVAARIHGIKGRVRAHLHGACIGAGIELPAFAGRVSAQPDTVIQLPELRFGLVPGAGGTVSITRRAGRWRCAFLALSGIRLDARTALDWGLVDELGGPAGDE